MNFNTKSKYSVVDLFAGIGGISCGFLQRGRYYANYVKETFENNKNEQQTYKNNLKNAEVYGDVSDTLSDDIKEKLGKVDVVIGGSPCQGFFNVNRQKIHVISQNNSLH